MKLTALTLAIAVAVLLEPCSSRTLHPETHKASMKQHYEHEQPRISKRSVTEFHNPRGIEIRTEGSSRLGYYDPSRIERLRRSIQETDIFSGLGSNDPTGMNRLRRAVEEVEAALNEHAELAGTASGGDYDDFNLARPPPGYYFDENMVSRPNVVKRQANMLPPTNFAMPRFEPPRPREMTSGFSGRQLGNTKTTTLSKTDSRTGTALSQMNAGITDEGSAMGSTNAGGGNSDSYSSYMANLHGKGEVFTDTQSLADAFGSSSKSVVKGMLSGDGSISGGSNAGYHY